MKNIFATNVKKLRFLREWNQKIVAEKLGISVPAYSKIESGVTDPSLSRVEQIAKIYNVRPETLLVPIDDMNFLNKKKNQ